MSNKSHLRLVVLGHYDSGKTATIGRLMEISDDVNCTVQACEKDTMSTLCELLHNLEPDMEHYPHKRPQRLDAWTIGSIRYTLTFFDVPGFCNFTYYMLKGFNQANASLLVVSAEYGQTSPGQDFNKQTREHLLLARTMGVTQILVAINKMDIVNYCQERYDDIRREVCDVTRDLGYLPEVVSFVPISCETIINFTSLSDRMPWYNGPTMMQALDELKSPQVPIDRPLRFVIYDKILLKNIGTVVVGQVKSGVLKVNDQILVVPGNLLGEITQIQMNHKNITEALPGDSVGCVIKGVPRKDLRSGLVIGHSDHVPPVEVIDFTALIIIASYSGEIREGFSTLVDCHSSHVLCRFDKLLAKYDVYTGQEIASGPNISGLKKGDRALVRLVPLKPMVVEPFNEYAPLGRITVRDISQTIAYGIVKDVNKRIMALKTPLQRGKVSWIVYALTILIELYTAINPILLNVLPEELDFKVFAYTTYPRLAILIACSVLIHRQKFWQRYIKINALTAAGASSIVAYLFLVKGHGVEWDAVNSDQIHAMVAYGLMIFVLVGHYRTMLKWFPWTRVSFYCYKLVRFFHIIFFIVQESIGETFDNVAFVAYFSATLELLHEMMFEADEVEKEVKEHTRHMKKTVHNKAHELESDVYHEMGHK